MKIEVYHSRGLEFGRAGMAPRWLSVGGRVHGGGPSTRLTARLNDGPERPLWVGPDGGRLAEEGEFLLELSPSELLPGSNRIELRAMSAHGESDRTAVEVRWNPGGAQPPPCALDADLRGADALPPGVSVGDGRWVAGEDGWRTGFAGYDRCLSVGDNRWSDLSVEAEIVLHGWRLPDPRREAGANVMHFGLALRWPGHAEDGRQPRLKWYPLGLAVEAVIDPAEGQLRLRGLDPRWIRGGPGAVVPLESGARYRLRAAVASVEGGAEYLARLWPADGVEPTEWSLRHRKIPEPIRQGSILIVAHYTDITVRWVKVRDR